MMLARLLPSALRLVKAVSVAGIVRFVRLQPSTVREVRLVSPLGTEKLDNGFPLRVSTERFVSVLGTEKLVSPLISRFSETRLRAASNPTVLLILRRLASKFMSLRMSCALIGPEGSSNALRIAEFRPASGMAKVCAEAQILVLIKKRTGMLKRMDL